MTTKKTKTKTAKQPKKATKPEQKLETKQSVNAGDVSFVLNEEEMQAVISVLGFSKDIFYQMAQDAAKSGLKDIQNNYLMSAQVSFALFEKFKSFINVGEPKSREVH